METLKIEGKAVATINIEMFAKAFYKIHENNKNILNRLKLGMLDAKLCSMLRTQITEKVYSLVEDIHLELFIDRIEDYIQGVCVKIQKYTYKFVENKIV